MTAQLWRAVARDAFPLVQRVGDARVYRIDDALPAGASLLLVAYPTRTRTPVHTHSGGEHHFVLRGRVTGEYRGDTFEFAQGDYFYWDGDGEHTASNSGADASEVAILRVPLDLSSKAFGGEGIQTLGEVRVARCDPPGSAAARVRQLSALLPAGLAWWLVALRPERPPPPIGLAAGGKYLVVTGALEVADGARRATVEPGGYLVVSSDAADGVRGRSPPGTQILAITVEPPRPL